MIESFLLVLRIASVKIVLCMLHSISGTIKPIEHNIKHSWTNLLKNPLKLPSNNKNYYNE